ncbi:MAG: biopolymer transporter ExbD, partial [Pseudobdellovibrionaceae bacterium]
AFVQMMVIETELPQVVKEAIEQQELKTKTTITLEMKAETGFEIVVRDEAGKEKTFHIPKAGDATKNSANSKWDYEALHLKLREIKQQNPNVFKLNFAPGDSVTYQELIQATDEARKSRDVRILFEVEDLKTQKKSKTDYMFPEVIFVNMMEG